MTQSFNYAQFPMTKEDKQLYRWFMDHQWFEHWPDQVDEDCPYCRELIEDERKQEAR